MTNVTCGLTAKKPGSALRPKLIIEYGTTLLYFTSHKQSLNIWPANGSGVFYDFCGLHGAIVYKQVTVWPEHHCCEREHATYLSAAVPAVSPHHSPHCLQQTNARVVTGQQCLNTWSLFVMNAENIESEKFTVASYQSDPQYKTAFDVQN